MCDQGFCGVGRVGRLRGGGRVELGGLRVAGEAVVRDSGELGWGVGEVLVWGLLLLVEAGLGDDVVGLFGGGKRSVGFRVALPLPLVLLECCRAKSVVSVVEPGGVGEMLREMWEKERRAARMPLPPLVVLLLLVLSLLVLGAGLRFATTRLRSLLLSLAG